VAPYSASVHHFLLLTQYITCPAVNEIVFVHNGDAYAISGLGGKPHLLFKNLPTPATMSYDSKWILYSEAKEGEINFYQVKTDGSERRRFDTVWSPGKYSLPKFSQRNTFFTYSVGEFNTTGLYSKIYVSAIGGNQNKTVLRRQFDLDYQQPTLSPDGKRLVFVSGNQSAAERYGESSVANR
jgi:hypothetical protein